MPAAVPLSLPGLEPAAGHRLARSAGVASRLSADARALARSCRTIDDLRAALERFDGCALAETATQLCFADGTPGAPLFLVGEAPGAEEDRIGRPFVGQSGQLLDRMLAWIGRDRSNTWITNAIFWRPPGNRTPTPAEIAVCQPFLERQIELLRPRLLLFLGGIAARALLGVNEGVSRLRGRPRMTSAKAMKNRPRPPTAPSTIIPSTRSVAANGWPGSWSEIQNASCSTPRRKPGKRRAT